MAKFRYLTCCVDADGESITAMVEAARPVSLTTFRKRCDTAQWELDMGYGHGSLPTLAGDYHMRDAFHRSTFKGQPCYYAVHSAIEYVFAAPAAD